jgi:hypothetical protein
MMASTVRMPRVLHLLKGEAMQVRHTAYGTVGTAFSGESYMPRRRRHGP